MYIKSSKPAEASAPSATGAPEVLDAEGREPTAAAPTALGAFARIAPRADEAGHVESTLGGLFSRTPKPAPSAASPAKKGVFSAFARSSKPSASDAPAARAEVPVEPPVRAAKPAKPEKASKAPKAPKPPKPPKAPKAVKAPKPKAAASKKDEVCLLVELEDGKNLYWRVTSSGVEQIAREDATTLVSFSPKDTRLATDLPLSNSAANSMAMAELGEEVRLVNASKTQRAVFSTPATRVAELAPISIGPGLHVLEELLPMSAGSREDRIGGLQLHAADGTIALVVLYHFTEQGEVGAPQVTVNPSDLSFVLSQFVSARLLNMDTKVALVSNEDFLHAVSAFRAYPNQSSVLGIPLSKLLNAAALTSMLLAAGAGAYAGAGKMAADKAKSQLASALSQKTRHLNDADELLKVSLVSFAKTQALDISHTMDIARDIWVPNTVVALDADLNRSAYTVTMPLAPMRDGGGGPSVLNRVHLTEVTAFIDKPLPEGCTKSILNLSGGLDAAQISVECESAVSGLRTYRLD